MVPTKGKESESENRSLFHSADRTILKVCRNKKPPSQPCRAQGVFRENFVMMIHQFASVKTALHGG